MWLRSPRIRTHDDWPIYSAAEPHGRTAAGSLDQNDSGATNGPEIGARAAASAPGSTSQVSDRLAVLAELGLAHLARPPAHGLL